MDYGNRSRSRSPRNEGSSRRSNPGEKIDVRLLIRARDAGAVIGKGGENVKRLRNEFAATVTVTDSQTVERLVVMRASMDGIKGIIGAIAEFLMNNVKEREESKTTVDLRYLIHQSQAGCIIGKGGTKLKELRSEMDVDLKVFSECLPLSTERIVCVIGTPEKATNCIVAIIEMLRTWPARGFMEEYIADNYDDYLARECGGYADEDGRGGRRSGGGGGGGGRRGDRRDYGRDRDRRGRGRDYDDAPMGPLGALSMMLGASAMKTTQQVSIPSEMAGVIIGRNGTNVRRIKSETGAEIEMDDVTAGPNDRIITIFGTPEQIQSAQYMMQMSVKMHLAKNK